MKGGIRLVRLQDVADLNPPLEPRPVVDEEVSFLPMSAVDADSVDAIDTETRRYQEVSKGYTPFVTHDVLVAKITPCFENGKIAQAKPTCRFGFGSTEFHVVRPHAGQLDSRFLVHFLRQDRVRKEGERKMTGSAGQRRVPQHFLADFQIPLPPLPEQRRIADILDRADALRAKRRAALAQLDTLTQSIFLEMFGDPAANPKKWTRAKLEEALTIPLRNGLSPSKAGSVPAEVLTLSAITGAAFDGTARKLATFQSPPPPPLPPNQTVDANDFLICRGNGNIRLVGKGYFPPCTMPDVTFPDTMIAARVSSEKVERAFLQHVWNSPAIRQQIESVARTTNGTFKVNQSMLHGIAFVCPPISRQRDFANRVAAVTQARTAQRASLANLDALFASLQHCAFGGELLF